MERRSTNLFASSALGWLLSAACPAHAAAPAPILDVVGTEFRLTLPGKAVARSRDLVGAVLTLSNGLSIRIDAVEGDPDDGQGHILLHTFAVRGDDGAWANLCEPGPDGRQQGFPLSGRFLPDGRLVGGPAGSFEIVCSSGAQGKCARFGYKPWLAAPDGRPLRDHYNACVRMVRADYCGDGNGTTRDGTAIDLYDRLGLQRSEAAPGMSFEAGWGPDGAACIAHVRVPENVTLDRLHAACPRLTQRPSGPACTEAEAAALGALIFNNSVDRSR
jgi:hypothetical protein